MKAWLTTALLLLGTPLAAQTWEVGCDENGCRVGQAVITDGMPVARVLVLQMQGQEVVEVLFPLGVSLLTPVFLHVDEQDQFEVRTASCDESGCYGIVANPAAAIAAFKAGAEMKLRFTGFADGQTYFFPFTLSGFTAAYNRYRNGAP